MSEPSTNGTTLADDAIVTTTVAEAIQLLEDAIAANRPLEIEPYRGRLFALFANAYEAGVTGDDGPLSSDEMTRLVGRRWNLDESARLVTAD